MTSAPSTRILRHASLGLGPSLSLLLALVPLTASAAPWALAPSSFFNEPPPGRWTTKVELADLDGDGRTDLLFANVGGYQAGTPDSLLANQAYCNLGDEGFIDVSLAVFGPDPKDPDATTVDTGRVIKAADVDGDGDLDLLVGCAWVTQSRLYRNDGGLLFTEVTATHLPQLLLSAGDAEFGDVDGDGDLDVVITGALGPQTSGGGRTDAPNASTKRKGTWAAEARACTRDDLRAKWL